MSGKDKVLTFTLIIIQGGLDCRLLGGAVRVGKGYFFTNVYRRPSVLHIKYATHVLCLIISQQVHSLPNKFKF